MKKTELFIPFTKKIAEAVGFTKEIKAGEKFFRCLRMPGYFPLDPDYDAEAYSERLCQMLLEKHEESLLYTESGLMRTVGDLDLAEEIYEKLSSAWKKDAPDVYVAVSRNDDEYTVIFGYEDSIEAVLQKNGKTRRISTISEPDR